MYLSIYIYTHTHPSAPTNSFIHTQTHVHTYKNIYTYIYIIYIHIYILKYEYGMVQSRVFQMPLPLVEWFANLSTSCSWTHCHISVLSALTRPVWKGETIRDTVMGIQRQNIICTCSFASDTFRNFEKIQRWTGARCRRPNIDSGDHQGSRWWYHQHLQHSEWLRVAQSVWGQMWP